MKMLRTARKKAGLTMKELGVKIGVSESAVSQYENGRREADFETLLKIAEVLDCSIDYLLRGADEKKDPAADEGSEALKQAKQDVKSFMEGATEEELRELRNMIGYIKSKRQ